MKYIILTLCVIWLTGCTTANPKTKTTATGVPLVCVDASRIENTAMKAITKKYADIQSSDLAFCGIQYSMKADGSEAVTVTYNLPSSTKQEDASKDSVTSRIIRVQTIDVTLSNEGKLVNISKGSRMNFTSGTK